MLKVLDDHGLNSLSLFLYGVSLCRALADVLLDRQLQDPRVVHGGMRPVRVLAVHPGHHPSPGVDAPGPPGHPAEDKRVVPHGSWLFTPSHIIIIKNKLIIIICTFTQTPVE